MDKKMGKKDLRYYLWSKWYMDEKNDKNQFSNAQK